MPGKVREIFPDGPAHFVLSLNNEWFIGQIRQRTGRWVRRCVEEGVGKKNGKIILGNENSLTKKPNIVHSVTVISI